MTTFIGETFFSIDGFDAFYKISNYGRLLSLKYQDQDYSQIIRSQELRLYDRKKNVHKPTRFNLINNDNISEVNLTLIKQHLTGNTPFSNGNVLIQDTSLYRQVLHQEANMFIIDLLRPITFNAAPGKGETRYTYFGSGFNNPKRASYGAPKCSSRKTI